MATDEDASRAGFGRADVPERCDTSGLAPSDPAVYTKPQMRDRIKAEIYCSGKGGDLGEWSARKAQLTVQRYEAEGGGYKSEGEFETSQESLMIWTEQDWQTEDGTPSLPEGDRYFPKDFWDALTEEEKRKVNETKQKGTEEGKQFVSLPEDISEKFAEWREENREKYLEEARENESRGNPGARQNFGARENPNPVRERRQRQMAREAHRGLLQSIEAWDPTVEPTKVEQTTWYGTDIQHYNVLYAGAQVPGLNEEIAPLHVGFHGARRIALHAVYKGDAGPLRVAEQGEPGIFLRVTGGADYPDPLKKVDPGALTDSDFLRAHGARGPRSGEGPPNLRTSFQTVEAGVAALTHPRPTPVRRAQVPSVGFGEGGVGPDPSEAALEERTDALAEVARVLATYALLEEEGGYELRASDPEEAERAMREAISNLQAAKEQITHVLRQERSTFVHEVQHHLDVRRAQGRAPGSSTMIERGVPTDEYFNATREVNARYQEGLFEFEETILSNDSDLRRRMEGGFGPRDLFRLLKRFTPQFEKLGEENRQRLYKRWFRYWKEIVEPKMQEIRQEMEAGDEGGGLPEDLTALLEGAGQIAEAQRRLEERVEKAPSPLARPIETDRKLSQLEKRIREAAEALREKAEARGYDFGTIAERTGLEPIRDNAPAAGRRPGGRVNGSRASGGRASGERQRRAHRRENPSKFDISAPEDRRHLERGVEFTDPDDFITGFGGEPANRLTEGGTESVAFRQWFGDWMDPDSDRSVVTDEEGRPLEVYHGTTRGGFNQFLVGEELHDGGSPGVFFTKSRDHAFSYAGSDQDIAPVVVGPGEVTDPSFGFEVEVIRAQKRGWRVLKGGEEVGVVLEEERGGGEILDAEEGVEIEETTVDRYEVVHRGKSVLYNGSEKEKIAAIEAIVQEANNRAEIPPGQEEGILTAYLNVRDPMIFDFEGESWDDPPEGIPAFSTDELARMAKSTGHDGLILKNIIDPGPESRGVPVSTEYVVFGADQVAVQGARSGQIAIPRDGDGSGSNSERENVSRGNPPAEATVEVPEGPTYAVGPEDIILREGAGHEELSREKIAAPPQEARTLAQKARKWKEKGAPGMHETGLRRMLQIGAGYQLSPAEMQVVKNWFARKKPEKEKGYHEFEEWAGQGEKRHDEKRPSESLLSWWGWGGAPMMEWVETKLAEMPDRVRGAEEARENPRSIREAFGGGADRPMPESPLLDLVTEVKYPVPGTDIGFELRAGSLGETYAYGFARRPDFDGEEFDRLAEISWIQVEEEFRGEGAGGRLLGDTLRWLRSTGARHVAVRPLSEAAEGLNERAEQMGLWHFTMESEPESSEEGMEMYAIDVGPQDRTGVPVTGKDFEFEADRDDVEWAAQRLYSPDKIVQETGAQPTEEMPYTYVQPRRPIGASADLESEFGRQVEKYERFKDAPGTSKQGGFFFRTGAPIRADQLRKTGVLPHGIDSRTWALVNTASNYQGGDEDHVSGLPEFAIVNTDRRWIMELAQGEGAQDGKTLLTFHRPGERSIEVHQHDSLSGALEETLRFVGEEESAEYLPLEFVDTALEQWEEEKRENPEPSPREIVAGATEELAYRVRRRLWDRGHYSLQAQTWTEDLLRLARQVEEGEVTVDPSSPLEIPLEALSGEARSGLSRLLDEAGVAPSLERFAGRAVAPDLGPEAQAEPFDPFDEEGLGEILKAQCPVASSWKSAAYLVPDGTALSPRSRGGGGEEEGIHVPGRFVPDWVPEEDRAAASSRASSTVAVMEDGTIRLTPGRDLRIGISAGPTPEQKEWIRRAIGSSDPPDRVTVSVQTPGEHPDRDSETFPPAPGRVISFIERFYTGGPPSKMGRARRRNSNGHLWETMAQMYPRWRPEEGAPEIPPRAVKWVLRGGQAIGAKGTRGEEVHHNQFAPPESAGIEGQPRLALLQRGAVSVWVTDYNAIDRVALNAVLAMPPTASQRETLRALINESEADAIIADLTDSRTSGGGDSQLVETESAGAFLREVQRFYAAGGISETGVSDGTVSENGERPGPGRHNPEEDGQWVLAVGDAQSAYLQNYKPESQRLVTMRPDRYLTLASRFFAAHPMHAEEISVEDRNVSAERVEEMAERMRQKKPLDAAWFDVLHEEAFSKEEDRKHMITGQEGRHRALAARRLGLGHMPVILFVNDLTESRFGDDLVPRPTGEESKEIPDVIEAGTTPIEWPGEPTPTKELWRAARFGHPA